jgi:hypothetical protein
MAADDNGGGGSGDSGSRVGANDAVDPIQVVSSFASSLEEPVESEGFDTVLSLDATLPAKLVAAAISDAVESACC